ncbi:N-acetylglucosamine-6-phosphate deacetylase [Sneathiella aquimaris]|uniref:N-acetylglucosamine-6-phosphate deacetylase n=1 Tax=Sneathiella aquimaris TaxID=2599305 RepID=UPI00146B42E4|nr:N-acetylglucosamine-6-phosphate deacetylase [Sneathiella aquimaris]
MQKSGGSILASGNISTLSDFDYITAGFLLIDGEWATDHLLHVTAGKIKSVLSRDRVPEDAKIRDLGSGFLVPGFFDIQVNGGGGILLNDAPTMSGLEKVARAHLPFGTTSMLPTLITDEFDIMRRFAGAYCDIQSAYPLSIKGLHFEGPYLNPVKKGVHNERFIRNFEDKFLDLLDEFGLDHVLITLAPEKVSSDFIQALVQAGVIVAAGHTDATYEQTMDAVNAGLTGFTHLYNAMPPMLSRAPGVIGAAFQAPSSYCSIIADGDHVHPAVLKNAIASKTPDHTILITDAMPCVGSKNPDFILQGEKITVKQGRCTTSEGVLAGSAISMEDAVMRSINLLGQTLEDSVKMASETPARFMGLDHKIGLLKPDRQADLVFMDQAGQVQEVLTTF